jgi:hypothetical protein
MLIHDTTKAQSRTARTRANTTALHRCGSWHGSPATCPCHLDRIAAERAQAPRQDGTRQVPSSVTDTVRERGTALDEATRRQMQARLGHDFGAVRVHSGPRAAAGARAVGALAYTVGEHVVLDTERLPSAPSERASVLAHELVHTVQQGPLRGRRLPDRVSDPNDTAEREAHRITGSDHATAARHNPAVNRQPRPAPGVDTLGGVSLSIREDGRLEVTAQGPKAPGVGKPALGLRRNADGTYTITFGADQKTVAPSEVPAMLRSAVTGAAHGDVAPRQFRIPNCASLRSIDNTRWKSFDEYRATQMLSPDLLPLTPPLYDYLMTQCGKDHTPTAPPAALPPAPQPAEVNPPHEALPPVVPEGQAVA